MMNLSIEQLHTLRHMLGINTPDHRSPQPYRNYYCASPGNDPLWAMERIGAVRMYGTHGGYEWFCCTDAGSAAAMASHKTIRKSRGARLYSTFLTVSDCWPDLTFKRFLTDHAFHQTRKAA